MEDDIRSSRWTKEAVARLWSEHRAGVAALLYAHMPHPRNGTEVNDLLQEVAVSLVANIHRLSSPEKIGPWLRTVAINVARDAGRRKRVRKNTHSAGDGLDMLPGPGRETPGERAEARERGRRALEIVHGLTPEYREPLLLNLRGLSQRRVAELMELPVSTIETRIFRARAMVRAEMEAMEREERGQEGETPMKIEHAREAASGLKVSSQS